MGSIPFRSCEVRNGRRRNPSLTPSAGTAGGLNVAVMAGKQVCFMQQAVAQLRILSRGLGRSSPLNLALVGSFRLATGGTGATSSGVRAKNPAMKSSTMKGAKALGSKLLVETVPNREKPSFLGKGTLLVSCPRNRRRTLAETMLGREAETWSGGVEVGPPSNVTAGVTSSLIREGPQLPPVVRRCLGGDQVFQKLGTGRVA